jgi:hypothetical protein
MGDDVRSSSFIRRVLLVLKRGRKMRQCSIGFTVVIAAVVITVGGYSQRALAAASYSAFAQAIGFPGGPVSATFSAPIPVSQEYSGPAGDAAPGGPYGTLTTIGEAFPAPGALGTMGSMQLSNAYFGIGVASLYGTGNASLSYDDFIASGPPSSTVPFTVNLMLTGSYSTSISQNNPVVGGFGGNCASDVTVGVSVSINENTSSGNLNDESILQGSGAITHSYSDSGLLAGTGGMGTIPISVTVPVPANSPFSFGLSLNTTASFQIDINGTEGEEPNMNASAVVDYTDPFEFAHQAATLPDGYYLNSVEAGIVNNIYTPPVRPGDFNLDGHVNAADILAMEQALANLPAYQTANGLTNAQLLAIGDVNGDGKFNNADLQALINLLQTGGGSTNPVSEPSTFVLAVLAFGMISVRRRDICPAS